MRQPTHTIRRLFELARLLSRNVMETYGEWRNCDHSAESSKKPFGKTDAGTQSEPQQTAPAPTPQLSTTESSPPPAAEASESSIEPDPVTPFPKPIPGLASMKVSTSAELTTLTFSSPQGRCMGSLTVPTSDAAAWVERFSDVELRDSGGAQVELPAAFVEAIERELTIAQQQHQARLARTRHLRRGFTQEELQAEIDAAENPMSRISVPVPETTMPPWAPPMAASG